MYIHARISYVYMAMSPKPSQNNKRTYQLDCIVIRLNVPGNNEPSFYEAAVIIRFLNSFSSRLSRIVKTQNILAVHLNEWNCCAALHHCMDAEVVGLLLFTPTQFYRLLVISKSRSFDSYWTIKFRK